MARLPSHPQLLGVLNDAAHAPVFGALAVVIFELLERHPAPVSWRRYLAAFLVAVAIGGIVEWIQPFIGRGAEIGDLINDAFGAIGALALLAFTRSRERLALLVAIAASVPVLWPVANATVAYALRTSEFPTLLGGNSWPDRYFTQTRGVEAAPSRLPSAWSRAGDPESLRVRIVGQSWPGVTLSEPQPDWRRYSRLVLDLTNPESHPMTLTLRVHDLAHNNLATDRFNINLELAGSRRQTVVVPLEAIERAPAGRRIDLSRIAGLIIFNAGDPASIGRHYYITRIWLE